jgi:hypothetical protein
VSYTSGPGEPATLKPYLDDVAALLRSQSLLSFAAPPGTSGRHVAVDVRTEDPDVELLYPSAVHVPAAR